MIDCNDAWESFCSDKALLQESNMKSDTYNEKIPKCSNLYISTTTKISYFTHKIDLQECFWKIPLIPFNSFTSGVLKKQMKFTFTSMEEIDDVYVKLKSYECYNVQQITYVNNEDKNIYKDVRKINIGLCQKDVMSLRNKQKSAFYNCFVVILRIFDDDLDVFKEAHVKIFNTGKLELPGIKNDKTHIKILQLLCKIFNAACNFSSLSYLDNHETVLINSNFNCGFCLNRDVLVTILREKYNIETSYDPCSYPGIMCKVYLNRNKTKLSFMIFRTGSVLIVGKCSENDIYNIYKQLCKIFNDEFYKIKTTLTDCSIEEKVKKPRNKKRTVIS